MEIKKELIKTKIISLVTSTIFILIGITLTNYSDNVISKSDFEKQQSLCLNADTATAFLTNSKVEEVRVIKVTAKIRQSNFSYIIDGKSYNINSSTNIQHIEKPKLLIWYDKTDPSVNSFSNPCNKFEKIKHKKIGNRTFYDISGLILILLGAGAALNALKDILVIVLKKIFEKSPSKSRFYLSILFSIINNFLLISSPPA